MKLLFDHNISFRVVARLRDVFPDAIQVKNIGLENATDRDIWEYARIHGYVIMTLDSDFFDLAN